MCDVSSLSGYWVWMRGGGEGGRERGKERGGMEGGREGGGREVRTCG